MNNHHGNLCLYSCLIVGNAEAATNAITNHHAKLVRPLVPLGRECLAVVEVKEQTLADWWADGQSNEPGGILDYQRVYDNERGS